ncbi:hypothetical protein, partial [Pseudomonas sp. PA15(2017)]|uniref:hypothetical protein n=1 Tax=Pseudomonas sp. PA15(2017) TaxID=1932111 RepID=UPI001C456CDE
ERGNSKLPTSAAILIKDCPRFIDRAAPNSGIAIFKSIYRLLYYGQMTLNLADWRRVSYHLIAGCRPQAILPAKMA